MSHSLRVVKNVIPVSTPLAMLLITVLSLTACDSQEKEQVSIEDPVATYTFIKKSDEFPYGADRIEYKYGVFVLPKNYPHGASVKPNRAYIDFKTAWPDFGDRNYYANSDHIDRVRILFEIDKAPVAPLNDIYAALKKSKEVGRLEMGDKDTRFDGLIGYKVIGNNFFSYYKSSDNSLKTSNDEPIVIQCFRQGKLRDDGTPYSRDCRYHLDIDPLLKIRVELHKPMLAHFSKFHQQIMTLINSIRTTK